MKHLFFILVLFLASCDFVPTVSFSEKVTFSVEMATTPSQQAKGLMFRKTLCETCGMLFDFGREKKIGMWMKDTEISLDMIFLNAEKEIVYITERTTPFSLEMIMTDIPIQYVLEVSAGSVEKYGLKVGEKMSN